MTGSGSTRSWPSEAPTPPITQISESLIGCAKYLIRGDVLPHPDPALAGRLAPCSRPAIRRWVRFWGEAVAAYRIYCLDGMKRFTRTENVEAPSDEDAILRARAMMADCLTAEVWDRGRLVARLTPA